VVHSAVSLLVLVAERVAITGVALAFLAVWARRR
jgi:hypothetical protein